MQLYYCLQHYLYPIQTNMSNKPVFTFFCMLYIYYIHELLLLCAYNHTVSKVDHLLANEAKDTKIVGAHSIEELCHRLKRPHKISMLVKAGNTMDQFIEQLLPYLKRMPSSLMMIAVISPTQFVALRNWKQKIYSLWVVVCLVVSKMRVTVPV
jgi:hypothetical protein